MATLESSLKLNDKFTAVLTKIDNSLKQTTKSMDDFKQKVAGPAAALQELGNKASASMSKLNSVVKSGMSKVSSFVQSGKEKILSNFSNFGNGVSSKFNLSGLTSKFSSAFSTIGNGISTAWGKIKTFGSNAISIAGQTGQAFWQFGGEMKNSFSQMTSAVDPLISKLGQLLKVGLVAGGAALVGLGKKVYDVAGGFESQMSRVQAISGATGESFDRLTQQAIDLGAKTAFSATESAQGMENLASAGFDANEIMAAMPGLLDLAAVSGGDVALAAENSASALRGFGLEADQAGHVADVFAKAAADTNAEVADMGEAMKYVAPVANSMGLSIEEVAASIGIMSDAGVKGSQAGTTLRGALSRLAKPTKPMIEKMNELGLSFYDTNGQMKPLTDQVGMLQNAFKDLTPEQQQNALVTLFGQESLSGMMALIQKGPKALGDLTKSLEDSNGAAKEMAETMQNNLQSKVEQLGGAFESAFIRIGQHVFPMAGDAVTKFTDLIDRTFTDDKVSGFFEKTAKYGTVLKDAFDDVKGPISDAAGAIKDSIEKITGAFGSKKNVSGFKGMMDDVVDVITKVANFAENHSDQIATLITNLPKLALAFAGFKIASSTLSTLATFGGGLKTAAGAAKNLYDNLKKIKKPKLPQTTPTPETPSVPGSTSTPGVPALDFGPLLKTANSLAKGAGTLALVFGVVKIIEELAQAMKDINDKVPKNLSELAPKMANMGLALTAMGAFVKVAEKLTSGNMAGAAMGLATVAGISGNLILAAVALQQVNDRVSDDIGNVAKKVASMAVAIGGMGVLIAAVGAFASTGFGTAAMVAGLISVALIAGEMILTAVALQQFNDRVPDDIGGVKEKIALMAEAIGAFTAANLGGLLDLFSNLVGTLNIGVVTSGIQKMQTLAEELGKFDQITVPTGVEDKIEQLQDAIDALGHSKFGELVAHLTTSWDYSVVTDMVDKLVNIANSLNRLNGVDVDAAAVKTKIQDLNDAIDALGTGMGFWSKIGSSFSNSMDASVFANASASVDAMIQLGQKLSQLAGVDFDVEKADLNLIDITTIVGSMGTSGLGDLIGSMVQSAQLGQAQQSIQAVVNMVEPINQLGTSELQADAAIANINQIESVLTALAGLDGSGIDVATTNFSGLSSAMSEVATSSGELVSALTQVQTTTTQLVTVTQTSGTQITNTWTQTMNQSKAAVISGNAGMASAFSAGMAQSLSVVQSGNAQIVGSFNGLRGQLQSAGYFAMSGLAVGIQAGAGSAIAAAQSVASQVSATIRSALKVHSPSRVMVEIGQYVAQGLANGMLAMQSLVSRASNALAMATVPGALGDLSANGTLTEEVTMDDSEISKLKASADQKIVVTHKQVVPQVTVQVDNHNGEPLDEERVADLVSDKILEAMDSDLD